MNPIQLKLFPYIFLILSVLFSTFIWDKISIPFIDVGIVGIYSENKHHSMNDILRYLVFILLPLLSWLIPYTVMNKKKFHKIIFNFYNNEIVFKKFDYNLIYAFLIIVFFLVVDFLSLDFPIQKIDLVHEGQQLSSSYRSYLDNSLWSKSYVTVGIFFETLNAKIFWNIFNEISVGSFRFSILLYTLLTKILLIIFVFKVTNITNLDNHLKLIFFSICSIFFISFIDYNPSVSAYISYREIPIILSLILICDLFNHNKNRYFSIFVLSSLSLPVVIWSLDRGIIFNLILLSFILYKFIKKDYKDFILLLSFTSLSWFLFYIFFKNEFSFFISNSKNIISQMNYIHGIIHPTPFSDDSNSTRASKTLVLILINLIISIKLFFSSNKKFTNNLKFVFLYVSIVSFLSYSYALGRSDGPHIKQIFAYPLIFQFFFLSNLFLIILNKYLSKNIYKNNLLILFFVFLICSLNFNLNFNNLKSFNKRVKNFVNLKDTNFLEKNEIELVEKVSKMSKNIECIQLFSNDVALLYLLRKKSCSKFYFIWSVGTTANQNFLASELQKENLIISGGPNYYWDFPIDKKLPILDKYINNNYEVFQEVNKYRILKRKPS